MKSIFTRPLFVNPQAYLTIPELSYIQMATPFDFTEDSYSFIINTSGRIEGKLLKTSNDYILHLDLYSIDGNCVLGEFYLNNSELNTDNFNLTQSKNIITLQFGEQSSGNITYPGLIAAWSAKGKTNDDADRATLKDLTGNGHDITLNGFAFSEMSGYGGYNVGESNGWGACVNWQKKYDLYDFSHNKIHIKGCKSSWEISKVIQASNCVWESFKIKLTRNKSSIKIQYRYIDETGTIRENNYLKDGINIIPKSYNLKEGNNNINLGIFGFTTFYTDPDFECTIELLPEYPDALVFDGVNDYGINENMPIINDYTLIVKRQWVKPLDTERVLISNGDTITGLYATELRRANSFGTIVNFGGTINVSDSYEKSGYYYNYDIIYQNANTYNGEIKLSKGSNNTSLKYFMIGRLRSSEFSRYFKGAFYSAYLFDRSLDEQEIKAFIRKYIDPEYLLPSEEVPTPDCYYDLSQGSNDDETRDTIKDFSGNGNDAVAHNFAWRGMSGYDGHNCYFNSNSGVDRYEGSFTKDKAHITKIINQVNKNLINIYIINNFNIKISGLTGNNLVRIGPPNVSTLSLSNGTHKIDSSLFPEGYNYSIGILGDIGECDITIEILPEYPGALVFDGVDDYVSLDAFDSGFKTVFMVCKPFVLNKMLYDQRRQSNINNQFAIYPDRSTVAYNSRNTKGITYINSVLNNKLLTEELINKKQCITILNNNLEKNVPVIGASVIYQINGEMALYKFLGFKEALTEEQIQAVIKKYNLLDGVDEIEVS